MTLEPKVSKEMSANLSWLLIATYLTIFVDAARLLKVYSILFSFVSLASTNKPAALMLAEVSEQQA